jgi:hypothetical protein
VLSQGKGRCIMETEYVDGDELAAIEMAMSMAQSRPSAQQPQPPQDVSFHQKPHRHQPLRPAESPAQRSPALSDHCALPPYRHPQRPALAQTSGLTTPQNYSQQTGAQIRQRPDERGTGAWPEPGCYGGVHLQRNGSRDGQIEGRENTFPGQPRLQGAQIPHGSSVLAQSSGITFVQSSMVAQVQAGCGEGGAGATGAGIGTPKDGPGRAQTGCPSTQLKPPAPEKCHVTLELTDARRISAVCRYSQAVVNVFKSISSRAYSTDTRAWSFAVGDHAELVQQLQALGPHITVEPLKNEVLKALAAARPPEIAGALRAEASAAMAARLPPAIAGALMPFQREGCLFAVSHGGRALIGDEMGLGKTIQALAVACVYRDEWPLLVIAPSSLRLVWRAEILKWLTDLCEDDVGVIMAGRDTVRAAQPVTVISYDLVPKLLRQLEAVRFKVVVADESHFLKNDKAQRTKATLPLIKRATRAVLLTGTPATNRPGTNYAPKPTPC